MVCLSIYMRSIEQIKQLIIQTKNVLVQMHRFCLINDMNIVMDFEEYTYKRFF